MQHEMYAEQDNVRVLIVSNISPINNILYVSKKFAQTMTMYKTHTFEEEAHSTKLGPEEFTKDLPDVGEAAISRLNNDGVLPINTHVSSGDIIIGKVCPVKKRSSKEEELIHEIFKDKARDVINVSVCVPENVSGTITDVKVETRQENPSIKRGVYERITVSIRQDLPLMIGDILEDKKGKKGVVIGYIEDKFDITDCSIVANFDFDGTKITRNSSVLEIQRARSVGAYTYFDKPARQGLFNDPQRLSLSNFVKAIKSGYAKDLIYLAIQSANSQARIKVYESIIKRVDLPVNHVNYRLLLNLLFFLNGLGVKCIFQCDGKSIHNPKEILEIGFDKIINAEDLEISFAPLADVDIKDYSFGKVTASDHCDWKDSPCSRGIYSEQIFGPLVDWKCACGKYDKIKNAGIKCEKCGVVVSESSMRALRIGHMTFPIQLNNYVFLNEKNYNAVVVPPDLRPVIHVYNQPYKFVVSDVNELYNRVINRSNRVSRLIEINSPSILIDNELKLLTSVYEDLLFGQYNRSGYVDLLFNSIYDSVEKVYLDFSATSRAITNNNFSQGHVGIPINMAISLFSPFIIEEMIMTKKVFNYRKARDVLKRHAFDKNDEESFDEYIVNIFNNGRMPRIMLMSNNELGEAMYLTPIITDKPIFELNEEDYNRLNIADASELVKIFLPPINGEKENCENIKDRQIKEITLFDEMLNLYTQLPQKERGNNIISTIRNTKKINVNSFIFCCLTGRGLTSADRRVALASFKDTPSIIKQALQNDTKLADPLPAKKDDDEDPEFNLDSLFENLDDDE